MNFLEDMERFFTQVKTDDDVKVIVFQSADPDIFISHYDVGALTDFPEEPGPKPTGRCTFVPLRGRCCAGRYF